MKKILAATTVLFLTAMACNSGSSSKSNSPPLVETAATPAPQPSIDPTPTVSPTPIPPHVSGKVAPGTWAGQEMELRIGEENSEYTIHCGKGKIDQAITTDENGNFHATGSITQLMDTDLPGQPSMPANPSFATMPGEPVEKTYPAVYLGHVNGTKMDMTVLWTAESGDVQFDYRLERDKPLPAALNCL